MAELYRKKSLKVGDRVKFNEKARDLAQGEYGRVVEVNKLGPVIKCPWDNKPVQHDWNNIPQLDYCPDLPDNLDPQSVLKWLEEESKYHA